MNSDAGNASPMTILVVDDEEAVRRIVFEMLAREGYRVLAADSALNALGEWREHQDVVDLVLTDFHLGTPTASDLIDAILEEGDVPFLLMTGNMSEEEEAEIGPKVAEILHKPISREDLLSAVLRVQINILAPSGEDS